MTSSVETLEASVQRLVGNFEADCSNHLSKHYAEAQACVNFITGFEAFAWDMDNEAGLAHAERDELDCELYEITEERKIIQEGGNARNTTIGFPAP